MDIKLPFSMVIVSKRNSGKSFLTKHLLKMFMVDNKLFDYIVLFSSTAQLTKDFECLPKKSILEDFSTTKINKILEYQKKAKESKNPKQCLIILDDTIGAKLDITFKTNLDLLFSRGRHYNISIIFISQYIKNYISATIRNNIDYLLFSVNNYNVIKIIYDLVVYDGSIKDFIKFVNEKTKNYTFLIYNNLNYSDNNFYTITAPKEIPKIDIKF
jgi:hypothetical protein